MSKEDVTRVVKECIIEIIPEIPGNAIDINASLKDMGANSVDRMDIVLQAMENLNINVPPVEFGKINNIKGLIDLLHDYSEV